MDNREDNIMEVQAADRQAESPGRRRGSARALIVSFLAGAVTAIMIMTILTGGQISTMAAGNSIVNGAVLQKLNSLVSLIRSDYYQAGEISQVQLQDGLYRGLVDALDDPYSVYYTAEEMQELEESLSGTFSGIGAYVSQDETTGYPKISGVMEGSPAEEAGLMSDDLICEVEGESMQGIDLDVAVSRIRGEEGTSVHLRIYRGSTAEYLEMDIIRAAIDSVTVSGYMLSEQMGIGYIQITEFDDVTFEQFVPALEELLSGGMQGLVLDLRDNPGGTVDAVTSVAQYLIPEGLVFYMEYPDGTREEYAADGVNAVGIPIVVLVNGNSASAAEILSSAIQDSGAGIVVGTQSYGKGVVQTIFSLTDGTAVKLTTSEYYTRNGNSIHGIGVTPDVEAALDMDAYLADGTDTQLNTALDELWKLMNE